MPRKSERKIHSLKGKQRKLQFSTGLDETGLVAVARHARGRLIPLFKDAGRFSDISDKIKLILDWTLVTAEASLL